MARDMKQKKQYDNEWQRQNCMRINFVIRNSTDTARGILILKENKIPVNPYIEKAVHNQLIADGYLSASATDDSDSDSAEDDDIPTYTYGVRVASDTGIPAAMDKVREDGHTVNSYIVAALREKLITDGYLSE